MDTLVVPGDFNKLRDRAYQIASEHGWHEERLSNEHFLCLVISELMEMIEADRLRICADRRHFDEALRFVNLGSEEQRFVFAFQRCIKDTVEDELADVCIRLFDLAGLNNVDLSMAEATAIHQINSRKQFIPASTLTEFVFGICRLITSPSTSIDWIINPVLCELFETANRMNIDLMWHIQQKMRYNAEREYKHGGKQY